MMRRLGAYESAEEVLLLSVGATREELPGDAVVENLGVQLLQGAMSEALRHLDQSLEQCEDHQVFDAVNHVLCELVRVSEEKRLSFHYFNKMLPYAARAVEYGKRATRALSNRGGRPDLEGEMRRLVVVNKCWLALSVWNEEPPGEETGTAVSGGFLLDMKHVRSELAELSIKTGSSDMESLALLEQAEGTSRYCEAAYLRQGEEALRQYDLAQVSFERALELLERSKGKRSIEYAACCVELGVCIGNRRRTVDFTPRAKLLAAQWYHRGFSIRKNTLGHQHPLTVRAGFGYASHCRD